MQSIRKKLYKTIFLADTREGKTFDVVLLALIFINVLAVMLESVPRINRRYGDMLKILEYVITGIFTIEYILRVVVSRKTNKYVFSFYGIVDLLAIIPTYLSVMFIGTHSLTIIRSLRQIRLFRVFKLTRYMNQGDVILSGLQSSWRKISVFLFGVLMIILVIGTIMYLVEGPENGFVSIPRSLYWAVVTVTTVGYGDIAPQTTLGQFIAGFTMLLGYAIIAVPTGIVTAEVTRKNQGIACPNCNVISHTESDNYCRNCGFNLTSQQQNGV
jgi:voltage-gated potassium channel